LADTDWNCTVLLSDFAQVSEGKLYVLGGGWTLCGPGLFQHALAIKVEVPWDEGNRQHRLEGALFDEDMHPVRVGPERTEARFDGTFEAGRPAGLPAGTFLDFMLAVNIGPMELPPGKAYHWSISIDGKEVRRARFRTRPAA